MPPCPAGLDIIRKCLGQHEIAVAQTTASNRRQALFSSPRSWLTPRGNGCRPIGRCARSLRWQRRIGWEPPSPMPGVMRSSPWSGSPERTISTRPICRPWFSKGWQCRATFKWSKPHGQRPSGAVREEPCRGRQRPQRGKAHGLGEAYSSTPSLRRTPRGASHRDCRAAPASTRSTPGRSMAYPPRTPSKPRTRSSSRTRLAKKLTELVPLSERRIEILARKCLCTPRRSRKAP